MTLLVERMRGYGTTVFAEMSALAVATGSINLGQGFPDTDGPGELLESAVAAIRGGHNQYPPGAGSPELRQAVARHQQACYGVSYDPDSEVLITAGATEAITAAVLALAGPGDEVVVLEPYYDSYVAAVSLGGATRRTVALVRDGSRWTVDSDALRGAITPSTKAILLNTPHNPSGTVLTLAELHQVAALAVERDLVVISDEVYEHLLFDGLEHVPIASLPGMRERTITVSSAGKTFSVTGWKIGWACAPPALIAAVRTVKQFLTYVSGAPFQPAVATALDNGLATGFAEPAAVLQSQRDLLCNGLAGLGFAVVRPQAGYFALVDLGAGADGTSWCRALPARAGVVAIPVAAFCESDVGDRFVRFAFCKRPEVLSAALTRLEAVAG